MTTIQPSEITCRPEDSFETEPFYEKPCTNNTLINGQVLGEIPIEVMYKLATDILRCPNLRAYLPPAENTSNNRLTRLMLSADYEVWLIEWPENGYVPLHTHHRSSMIVSVISGQLCQVRAHDDLRILGRGLLGPGRRSLVPHGQAHAMRAVGRSGALSIHIYAPSLEGLPPCDAERGSTSHVNREVN